MAPAPGQTHLSFFAWGMLCPLRLSLRSFADSLPADSLPAWSPSQRAPPKQFPCRQFPCRLCRSVRSVSPSQKNLVGTPALLANANTQPPKGQKPSASPCSASPLSLGKPLPPATQRKPKTQPPMRARQKR